MSSTVFEKALPTCLRVSLKDCNSLPLNFTVSLKAEAQDDQVRQGYQGPA